MVATARSYAQVLFSRSLVVGAALVAATFVQPAVGIQGLAAALLAVACARLLRFEDELVALGLYGYNAVLVGLGVGALVAPGPGAAALLVVAVFATVLLTAASRSALGAFAQPVLTLPFLLVFYLLLAAAPELGLAWAPAVWPPADGVVATPLRSLGAIFFLPSVEVGVAILVAVAVHSRIALSLVVAAAAMGSVVCGLLPDATVANAAVSVHLNMIFTVLAIGGVWFVPGPAAWVLALAASLLAGLVTVAGTALLARVGMPVLILPFNLVVWSTLWAMRQRARDGAPHAVDFIPGTPEANLAYFRTRFARFGAHYAVRVAAPFLGRWTCTQGPDGRHTHKGLWRHGLDFEVLGPDGSPADNAAREAADFHCYGLPVIAVADGTVVRVVNDVADNAIGDVNLQDNWGNLVLIHHGLGLYSLVAHLQPGSALVREGQVVRRGEPLGSCGNSGRSPRPHLHFQLQASPRVGAPTIVTELHDVVCRDGPRTRRAEQLVATHIPQVGDALRNITPDAWVAACFRSRPGTALDLQHGDGLKERLEVEVDLFGNRVLRSTWGAQLFYECSDRLYTVFDVVGPRRSALHLIRMALGRVPLEASNVLSWADHVPRGYALNTPLRLMRDAVAPFLPAGGLSVGYTMTREGDTLHVRGQSERRDANGRPWLETSARLSAERGLEAVSVRVGDKVRRAERISTEGGSRADALGHLQPRTGGVS